MKEKKEQEIGVNRSSGAKKVETVAKQTTAEEKKAQESARAQARVEVALEKQKAKRANRWSELARLEAVEYEAKMKKRAQERKALAEKRKAERLARAEKLAEERKVRAERRKEEEENRARERAHAKASRSQKRSRSRKQKREKGYGGWLAAVVSLGAITLALTTAVTVGAIDMKRTKDGVMAGYRGMAYELAGVMENVDNDLDRARISNSPVQQGRILTDLLVQARLAELDLEKMPVSAESDKNLTAFINRVAMESERMLAKLRRGEKLSTGDQEVLERLYQANHQIRTRLDEYISQMSDGDIASYMKNGEGQFGDMLTTIEGLTMEENRLALGGETGQKTGAGMGRKQEDPAKEGMGSPQIDSVKAEELCVRYFSDYKIASFQCVGETNARGLHAYNVQGYADDGTQLFAELDVKTGALVRFDFFEACEESTFDLQNARRIAEEFLGKMGYEDMTPVRVRENGTDIDFTFAYQTDGVVFYPDSVRVKVCRSRGMVAGMDATKYLKNHKRREAPQAYITLESAQGALHNGLTVEASRLAVVHTARGERPAYEFLCSYGEEKYFIYTDAQTGDEISILNVKSVG